MVRFVTAPELVMELPNLFLDLHAERLDYETSDDLSSFSKFTAFLKASPRFL